MLVRAVQGYIRHQSANQAGSVAFSSVLAMFPLLLFLSSAAGFVGRPGAAAALAGRVIAYAPQVVADALQPVVEQVLSRLTRYTPSTVTEPATLAAQLAQALRDGYASTVGELEAGLNAVAAPVRRADGEVVAALSISAPAFRLPAEALAGASAEPPPWRDLTPGAGPPSGAGDDLALSPDGRLLVRAEEVPDGP